MLPDLDFTKIAKSWLFYCGFWHFWLIFGKTNLVTLNSQLPVSGSWGFSATRYGFHKKAKSWLFYWGFWHFWLIFGKTNLVILNAQLPVSGSWGFSATRYGFKKKSQILTILLGFRHFLLIFGKTTSGNTVRTGHQNNWDGLMSGLNMHHYEFIFQFLHYTL